MSIALFAVPGVLAPLQGLWRWFVPATTQSKSTHSSGNNSLYARYEPQISADTSARRPLRIVRVLEADQAPAHVGRMLISGRMADVCAELDRLAAREAALH